MERKKQSDKDIERGGDTVIEREVEGEMMEDLSIQLLSLTMNF